MRIGVIGLNDKLADLSLRDALAKVCQKRFAQGSFLHDDHTFVLISTCNRIEIYFSSDDLVHTHSFLVNLLKSSITQPFDQKLYSYFGFNCFLHLVRVVSGLDSAIVAETEIQGQVKMSYERARRSTRLPKELHYLFQKTLKIGKLIRSEYLLTRGIPDVEHAIYNFGKRFFSIPNSSRILFVGASAINNKVLNYFKRKQHHYLTLCNRSPKRGQELARHHGIAYLPWQQLHEWTQYDWIIFGTKAPEPLITSDTAIHLTEKKLFIDLSVPRNVDPLLAKHPLITLCDIDQLNLTLAMRQEKMSSRLLLAERKAALETCRQLQLFCEREKRRTQKLTALAQSTAPFDKPTPIILKQF